MTENEARGILHMEFEEQWRVTNVPSTFDNEIFDSEGLPEWVRLAIRHVPGEQHTLGEEGGRRFRRRGLVVVELFVQPDRGLQRLDELATAARDIFEGKTLNQVMLHDGNIREAGTFSSWYKGIVTVGFSYDETK